MNRVEISYSSAPRMSRVKVVYYLSHGGRLEQPHLIEVERQNNSSIGLSLSDVKKRLTAVRGKGMPDAFSWAYKRSFKNDFIWNDVTENDVILPFREDEYIMKGSENVYGNHDHHYRRIEEGLFESPVIYQRNAHLRASPTDGSPSPLGSVTTPKARHNLSIGGALRVNRKLMDSLTQAKTESTIDEAFANPNSDGSSTGNFSNIKVYKTPSSPITIDHGMDAATQTEDHVQEPQITSPVRRKADRVPSFSSAVRKQPEEPNGRRQQAGTMVFRHMLACGGVDTITTSPSKAHYRVQNWSSWTKPRLDADVLSTSTKFSSSKSPDHHSEAREQHFHGQQDPESMPEVVKETTCLASDTSSRMTISNMEKRPPLSDRSKDLRGQNSVRFAVKEVRRAEDSSPRSSTASKRVLKTSDQQELLSPALRCEDGSLTKRELCRDDRPLTPGRSRLDWERTLLEAVNSSAPPVDFRQILQECQQCGRTFKPDSLKVHLRGCHGQKTGKSTALMTSEAKQFP